MGKTASKEEKTIDSNGNINNNLVLEGPVDFQNSEMLLMLGIICAIKIFEAVYFVFHTYKRSLKKKYNTNTNA